MTLGKLRKAVDVFRRTPFATKRALPFATGWLLFVSLGLRVMSLPKLAKVLGVDLVSQTPSLDEPGAVALNERQIARIEASELALRVFAARGRCVRRALVLGRLLRSYRPVMRIGVERLDVLSAHAWIEVNGAPLASEDSVERFAVLRGATKRP